MNKSESAFERLRGLSPEQLDVVIKLFTDATAAAAEPPPGPAAAQDLYMALHPDVRRLLIELGQDENKPVKVWLLDLDGTKVGLIDELIKDYKNTKSMMRLIKMIWLGLISMIVSVYGVVKGAPEVWDWIRNHFFK